MIIVENVGNRERRYSNLGVKLRQVETGNLYDDAVDKVPCAYTYEETETPVDSYPMEPQDALDLIFGGDEDGSV